MDWRDEAIESYVRKILTILTDGSPDFAEIVFVGKVDDGVVGASAIYYDLGGKRHGVDNFFDVAEELKSEISKMHDEFCRHGENWKSVKISFDSEDNLDMDFDYNDPFRWALHEFPAQR